MNYNYHWNLTKLRLLKKYPNLIKIISANYGINLKLISEETKPTHYVFGVSSQLKKTILKPESNWLDEGSWIEKEKQSGNFESMNCTNFSFLNIIEILFYVKFGETRNFSDRCLGIWSGTTPNGNVPTKVIDTARKRGLVPEADLPNNFTTFKWNDYYSYKGSKLTEKELEEKGKAFVNDYEIGYESVYPSITAMVEALKYSPLYVAGYAWYAKNGIYYSYGNPNHAFVLLTIDDVYAYKRILDSYDPFIKKCSPDYQIFYPKIITLNKRSEEVNWNLDKLAKLLKDGIKYFIRANKNGEFYKIKADGAEFVPDIRVIADEIAMDLKQSPENINDMLKFLTDRKKVWWISEADYNGLIK
jgi:hypothetical protein